MIRIFIQIIISNFKEGLIKIGKNNSERFNSSLVLLVSSCMILYVMRGRRNRGREGGMRRLQGGIGRLGGGD